MRHLLFELLPIFLHKESWIYKQLPTRSLCTLLGHIGHTGHTTWFAVARLGDSCNSSTKQPVRVGRPNAKFKGYSCTDALHFSPGTAVSKMLQYSDEGPIKGQIEICLHIWTNICEQFSPLFSKLYTWPIQLRSVVFFKILLGTAMT